MPGWLTLVIDLEAEGARRTDLLQRLQAADGPINQTVLREAGREAGSLAALSKEALKTAKDATSDLEGRARALRVDADIIAADRSAGTVAFVFLAVDLNGHWIDHDDPTVNGAIRAYLGQYLPILGPRFIAVSTLLDRIMYAGALTVLDAGSEDEARQLSMDDPWRRIYPGRVFQTSSGFFQRRLPPAGPGTQRSGGGSPWPFHWPA
jgi:hypothetical protein